MMEKDNVEQVRDSNKNNALIKMAFFVLFIVLAIVLVSFSPAKQYFTAEYLESFLESAGFWAPLSFVIIYVAGVCLFFP